LGKAVSHGETFHKKQHNGPIRAAISRDEGLSWQILGDIPLPAGTEEANFHERMPLLTVRASGGPDPLQHSANCRNTIRSPSSRPNRLTAITWTEAGQPARPVHRRTLLRHSSGALVSVFGHRQLPFGQQAMVSRDEGRSWSAPIVLRSDGPDSDLGYPASVELRRHQHFYGLLPESGRGREHRPCLDPLDPCPETRVDKQDLSSSMAVTPAG
jgi:hypothetical protein